LGLVPSLTIPTTVEEVLDPEWLSEALGDITGDDRILAVTMVESTKTLAEKVRFRVIVQGRDGRQRVRAYCVKAHLATSPGNTLAAEARFYRELAPLVAIRTPRAYFAEVDETADRAMIIMDDVIGTGGQFLSAETPYSLATTRDSLGQLASLHASTWGNTQTATLEWLSPRIAEMVDLFPTEVLQQLLDDGRGPGVAKELRDAEHLVEAVRRTAHHDVTCVIHGDTHSGNVYLDEAGRASWLDWQVIQRGSWATDISYHLATVLDIDTRRAHEAELLRHYLQELERRGVAAPAWEDAWEQYTLSFSYGYFLWVITRVSSRSIVLIHIPRLAAALADHDTFRRLGVV
jgi:aminoglycoside phosphotransferase (APT) family kinase protein